MNKKPQLELILSLFVGIILQIPRLWYYAPASDCDEVIAVFHMHFLSETPEFTKLQIFFKNDSEELLGGSLQELHVR